MLSLSSQKLPSGTISILEICLRGKFGGGLSSPPFLHYSQAKFYPRIHSGAFIRCISIGCLVYSTMRPEFSGTLTSEIQHPRLLRYMILATTGRILRNVYPVLRRRWEQWRRIISPKVPPATLRNPSAIGGSGTIQEAITAQAKVVREPSHAQRNDTGNSGNRLPPTSPLRSPPARPPSSFCN